MKVQLNTNLIPLFSGTYETQWEVNEYDDNGNELNIEYDHSDLMKSIVSAYQDNEKYILSELNADFIKSIKFLDTFFSPREYNFSTDQLDFVLTIDKRMMLRKLEELKDDAAFSAFLKDNYTSYDGFLSYTPNNYKELAEAIRTENDEHDQAISALITYLAKDNIRHNGGCAVEDMIYDNWQGNGYGGLDYTIAEEEQQRLATL